MKLKNKWVGILREKLVSVCEVVIIVVFLKEGFFEGYKWFVLGFLFFVYIFNFVDC